MKCPKCDNEIKEGNLYCEVCGEEIRIVPDFEPEIENSIEDNISSLIKDLTVDEKIDSPTIDLSESDVLGETKEMSGTDDDLDEIVNKSNSLNNIPAWLWGIFASFVFLLLLIIGILIYIDNSFSYQIKRGDKLFDKGQYKQATGYYEKAIEIDNLNSICFSKLADCYIEMGNTDMAIESYKRLLFYDPNNSLAFASIISIYENESDYGKINDFLQYYGNDEVKKIYNGYYAGEPVFSNEGGSYDEAIILSISADGDGNIYYTLDGTLPTESSENYTIPIQLKKGNYIVRAIFVNEHGISSKPVSAEFSILEAAPNNPVVSLESGDYETPQQIRVIIPDDCNVYYTLDGTDPNITSHIYGEPIDIPEGSSKYKFIAINNKGISSEILEYNYNLNLQCVFTKEQALEILIGRLVEINYILDTEGNLQYYPGKYIYLYGDVRSIDNISLYCYNEYYATASTSRDMTSNVFGVDVNTGAVYRISKSADGSYSLIPM